MLATAGSALRAISVLKVIISMPLLSVMEYCRT
jgi:hypothetical protein